jgi:uncharacterized FAD-dependent dehydrogenase
LRDAVAGDITAAMPYRTMTDIIAFIKAMDNVVPGFLERQKLCFTRPKSSSIPIRSRWMKISRLTCHTFIVWVIAAAGPVA